MFWIFVSFVGLLFSAVTLGRYSVWLVLLKIALLIALLVIAVLVIVMMYRRFKGNR